MSVAQPHSPTPAAPAPDNREIMIVSHSNLFYWWPVWAVGFLLGILSLIFGEKMATVPNGTQAVYNAEGSGQTADDKGIDFKKREILVLPPNTQLHRLAGDNTKLPEDPRLHMARTKGYGVLFATVLLLVIVITNVPLRGMWSVMVIVMLIMLSVIFALANLWGTILYHLGHLDVRINAGGYFYISIILFLLWLITFVFFDKQVYMIFTPGQLKVCTEIGGGEKMYPAVGMSMEKQRSDLFRHWILGLGSGDLVVKTFGAQAHHFDLPNVLFIGKKVHQIEDMLKKQAVIETR
jgi:hypothetical protein